MCGIVGIVSALGRESGADAGCLRRMRDRLAHRGPDDAGEWLGPGAMFGHRRLSVVDLSAAGHQPMSSPDGRFVLVYNGELYNDAAVRRELDADGTRFRTSCDTETVLHAVGRWGVGAAARLRGMFALALWDAQARRLLLARDGLGIKPLCYTVLDGRELVFASEPAALFEHPDVPKRPDWGTISAYLTTIRVTLDDRTMFDGVRTLRAGAWLEVDASGPTLAVRELRRGPVEVRSAHPGPVDVSTRRVVGDAVRAHLRSDVPLCALLSGGLDSTIVAAVAQGVTGRLTTYCAGAVTDEPSDDFAFAREAGAMLGATHREVLVSRAGFVEGWRGLVAHHLSPMSTPNEVAIHAVAKALRGEGHVVVLSGEGADELFGGYGLPLGAARAWIERSEAGADGGAFELASNAWVPPREKAALLTEAAWARADRDAPLAAWYSGVYAEERARVAAEHGWADAATQRLETHLRMHRAINLEGLLRRLDGATMAASVEGRTPFADEAVRAHAEGLAMSEKFAGTGASAATKIALRAAFAGVVPGSILARAKASFPLPFRGWLGDLAAAIPGGVGGSALLNEVLAPAALRRVQDDPCGAWTLAWPAVNLAAWAGAVWGR